MNTKTLLPLTAAAVFALCAGSMFLSAKTYADNNVQATSAAARAVGRRCISACGRACRTCPT